MGLFWELFQELQIHKRKGENSTLEERVFALEEELIATQDVLERTLEQLEVITNQDFNGDGSAPR